MERSRARMISLRRRTPTFSSTSWQTIPKENSRALLLQVVLILSNTMPTISKIKLFGPITADGDGTYSSLLEHQNQWLGETCSTSSTAAPQQHQNSQAPLVRLAAPRLCNPSYSTPTNFLAVLSVTYGLTFDADPHSNHISCYSPNATPSGRVPAYL